MGTGWEEDSPFCGLIKFGGFVYFEPLSFHFGDGEDRTDWKVTNARPLIDFGLL